MLCGTEMTANLLDTMLQAILKRLDLLDPGENQ